jgi:SAM-dependent methyltransferase
MDRPRHKHTEVLRRHLPLAGARVADIGCGDGALVRFMTGQGARVTGVECSHAQLARAKAAEPAGDEDYLFGMGEHVPFADRSLDAVVYFNSLHHVAVENQGRALDEAARILRPGGLLYAQEPLAEGAFFELVRPVEDETHVRAKAHEALRAAAGSPALRQELEFVYLAPVKYESFEQLRGHLLAVDERRRPALNAQRAAMCQKFERAAERRDGAFWFEQPSRLDLLRRVRP